MPSIYDWTKYAMYISSIVQLGANRDLVWQWNNTGIFTEIFQEIFQEVMSSINQEFLPLYRIQSFGKICCYAPYFLIKDYTYRSIWRIILIDQSGGLYLSINLADYTYRSIWRITLIDQSGAIRCIRCCAIFQEFLQKSSKNLPRIFQESFFFLFLFFQRLTFSIFFFGYSSWKCSCFPGY